MASHRVVLANGVFDLFHVGHVRYLEAAAQLGDVLLVSVTADAFVNKGPGRPIYSEQERLEVVRANRNVTAAFLTSGSRHALEIARPAVFVKGMEYRGKIRPEDMAFCQMHGIEILFTDTETVRPRDRARIS